MLPTDVRARLDLLLYSDLEARVPFGAYQTFFLNLLRSFFETEELDLAPYLGTESGACIVRGRSYTIRSLRRHLSLYTPPENIKETP